MDFKLQNGCLCWQKPEVDGFHLSLRSWLLWVLSHTCSSYLMGWVPLCSCGCFFAESEKGSDGRHFYFLFLCKHVRAQPVSMSSFKMLSWKMPACDTGQLLWPLAPRSCLRRIMNNPAQDCFWLFVICCRSSVVLRLKWELECLLSCILQSC